MVVASPRAAGGAVGSDALLEINDLRTHFFTHDGVVRAVDGVTLSIQPGETLGLVGESGCGKSVTAHSLLRLLPPKTSRIVSGSMQFTCRNGDVVDLAALDPRGSRIRSIRGNEIAMIFQEPMTSLSPVHTVGSQIAEAVQLHQGVGTREAMDFATHMLGQVGIGNPKQRAQEFPHQFSGGMRQRAMIAMALSCNPSLLIADEPTTALDVTIQAQILELMDKLKDDFDSAVILITHDLGVVAEVADEILVMYAGRVVAHGAKRDIFYDPQHPYTWGLLGSIPRLDRPKPKKLHSIRGLPPSLINLPGGCKFRPRCPHAFEKCEEEPELMARVDERQHLDRCWLS